MKNKIAVILTKHIFAFLLILLLVVPTLSGCASEVVPTNNNVSIEEQQTATLEVVSLEETTREEMGWTQVAHSVIPSIVAITSHDEPTGQTGSGSGISFIITNAQFIENKLNSLTLILPDETPLTAEDNER